MEKPVEEYMSDLRKQIMGDWEMVVSPDVEKSKDEFVKQYRDISDLIQTITSEEDYKIKLTSDEKQVLEDVTKYKELLGSELEKDFEDMDFDKLAKEFAKINPILDELSDKTTTLYDELKFLRDRAVEGIGDPLEFLKKQIDSTFSQTFDKENIGIPIHSITQAAKQAMELAMKQGGPDVEKTLDEIFKMSMDKFAGLGLDEAYLGNIEDELKGAYEKAILGIGEVPEGEKPQIDFDIDIESVAERLQTAINSKEFQANANLNPANMEEFIATIQALDLQSTIGLDPNETELQAAILAIDIVPKDLLFNPKLGDLTNLYNQIKQEMGISVTAEGESKATGGYTAPVGRSTPAGIVHGGEWVAPAWMVQDSKFSRAIESLEQARTNRGYASGGTVMPQQTNQQTLVFNFNGQLIQDDPESKRKIAEWVHESFKEAGAMA
jgi:hypothetical protein